MSVSGKVKGESELSSLRSSLVFVWTEGAACMPRRASSVTAGSPAHSVTASNHEDGHLEIPRSAKRRKTSPEGNEVDVHEKVPEPIGTGPVSEVSPDVSNANLSRAASAAVEPVAQVTSARKRGHKRDLPADEDEGESYVRDPFRLDVAHSDCDFRFGCSPSPTDYDSYQAR